MKKKYLALPFILLFILIFPITVCAGDLNGAEQGIISAISATYEYNGAYYKVTDGYISQVSAYLSQDGVDLSDDQASEYLSQFYANIGTGISSGYMTKVGDATQPQNPAPQTPTETQPAETTEETVVEPETTEQPAVVSMENNPVEKDSSEDEEESTSIQATEGGIVDNTAGSTQSGVLEYTVAPMEATMYVWEIDELDVHKEAYKDSEIIGTLKRGEEVKVTGAATTGWAQIDYNGEVGYCSATYLRTDGFIENLQEESVSIEESTQPETEETSTEQGKDYSNASAFSKGIKIEMIAVAVVVILLIASVVIVLWHKNKKR